MKTSIDTIREALDKAIENLSYYDGFDNDQWEKAMEALSTIDPEIVKLRELLAWAMTYVDSDHDAGLTFPAERKMAEIAHAAILGKEAEK